MTLANRVQKIKPSPTLTIAARARQLQSEGKDIINLSIGEPDFDTPEHIKEAARKALHDGFTKYTAVDGIPGLKAAIIQKFIRDNQLHFEPKQIVVTSGSKQALYNVGQALLNKGDEVIIPTPSWVSYVDMMLLAEAKPVLVETSFEQRFKLSADQLAAAITPKTRLLMLNSPSNPTGISYTRTELHALAEVLMKHPQVYIVSDDMYEHILWGDEPFANILNVCPELANRTIVCNGVSKSYAMTGWRIGYAAGPIDVITAMTNIQSQSTSNANSIAQVAAKAAIEGDQQCVKDMAAAYHRRHDLVYEGLSKLPGIKIHRADGAFYSFPDMTESMKKLGQFANDIDFAEFLLNKTGVVVIPGSAFGTPNCMRLSYAASDDSLILAIKRLENLF